ncbi:MAG TPA: FtsX-like permease family protein [Candidatus Limnocylindrales bacterium]
MRGLVPYAWRSVVARPVRSLLTAVGIALGVAVLVAALAVSAGLDASIDRTVASLVGRADLRVAAFAERGLGAATLDAVAAVPGVALAAPAIERRTYLAAEPGRLSATGEPVTVLGIDPASEPRVRDLALSSGAQLTGLDEPAALITQRLAIAEALNLGDELSILGAGAPLRVRVVGVLSGDGPELGSSGRTVVLPLLTAATLAAGDDDPAPTLETLGGLSRIDVVLAAGASLDDVSAGLTRALTTEPYVLSAPRDVAASLRASTMDIRSTMALLAAITLFAAAFLILNTLAMTVVERIRELGLLRAAGAGRAQVIRVVLVQALVLGATGSLGGIVLGSLLASLAAGWLRETGSVSLDGPALTPGVLAAGFAAGLIVTLVAALEPARRAADVSPVAALRVRGDPGAAVRTHTSWLVAVVGVVGVIAVVLLPVGGTAGGVLRTVAVYAVLLAAVLVTPVLLGPLGRIVGLPFGAVLRLEERLARASIARDPGRTTLTVGSLVVGLAMLVALGSVAANARATATGWIAKVVPGDEILTAIAPAPVGSGSVDEEVAAIDGVVRATPIATFDLAFEGTRLEATAVRGADLEADGRLAFVAGDRAAAFQALDAGGAVILPRSRVDRLGAGMGDEIAVATASGLVDLRVVGVVERSFPGRTGESVLVGWSDALDHFGVVGADAIAVRYDPAKRAAASAGVAGLAGQLALTPAPIARVEGAVADALDRVFGLLDLLALASVVIAGLGIVNTLSMDTWERVRELGMLRAAGMSRRQVWRSVLVEAGILGAVGALVGVASGVGIGVLLVATAGGRLDVGVQLPWGTIGLALVLGVALAMVAAAQPARLAGQRSIVSAVRGE